MANSFEFIQQKSNIENAMNQAQGRSGLAPVAFDEMVDVYANGKIDKTIFSADGIATFEPPYAEPLKQIVATFGPIQAGSGDPSPENVRSISGWTGAEVIGAGKNLLHNTGESGTYNNVSYIKNEDGSLSKESGTSNGWTGFLLGTVVLKPGTYILSAGIESIYQYDFYINAVGDGVNYGTSLGPKSFTLSKTTEFVLSAISRPNVSLPALTMYPMIRLASVTDATFEPYTGSQISVTFPSTAGTVYGGTLTINPDRTGALVVDRAGADLGTLAWEERYTGSTNKTILSRLPSILPHRQQRIVLAENYQYFGTVQASTQLGEPDDLAVGLRTYYLEEFSEFDNLIYAVLPIDDNPEGLVVYELATPITYTLTASDISGILSTVPGLNNVWTDLNGGLSVTYKDENPLFITDPLNVGIMTLK